MNDARVLIAVRQPLISDTLKLILEMNRFKVAGRVASAHDAIIQAELLHPDIILLDSQLVSGRGEDLIRLLSTANPRAKVVILTDGEVNEKPKAAFAAGVAGLIYKDASPEILLSSLRNILASKEGIVAANTRPPASPPRPSRSIPSSSPDLVQSILKVLAYLTNRRPALVTAGPVAMHPEQPSERVASSSRSIQLPSPLANLIAIVVCMAALAPLVRTYLSIYPPAGIDFIHGMFNLGFLRQHPGVWFSLWNYSWFNGSPFAREYGVLSSYLGLPFAFLLGDGSGLQAFIIATQVLFVLFTYILLKEISGRYAIAVALTVLVVWSPNLHYETFESGTTGQVSAHMFFPLCLYILVRYLRTRNPRLLVGAALLNGLAFLTHPIVGSLIAALMGVILLTAGDEDGRFLSAINARRLSLYGLLMGLVGGVIGVPLLAPFLFGLRMAMAGTAPTVTTKPQAPIDIFLTTNPALLAVLLGIIGWRVYEMRRTSSPTHFNNELFAFSFAASLLVVSQFAFARGMSPAPTSLFADRTWWIAPLLFATVVANLAKRGGAPSGLANGTKTAQAQRLAAGTPLVISVALVVAALIAPFAGWSRIEAGIKKTWLDPPVVVDALMGREQSVSKPIVPEWMDVNSTEVRAWIQNPRITMWWSALYRMPMTGGYYDPARRPWTDWRNWMQMAVNGNLASEPRYTTEAAKNVAKFLIDWFAIRYFVTFPGGDDDTPVSPYLLNSEIVQDKTLLNGLQTIGVKPEFSDPIVSATKAPTLLVIGDEVAYETIVRSLALANLGPRGIIPLRGPRRIDDVSAQELSNFTAVALYNYDYSDSGQAFGVLEEYVRRGGGLFIETGSVVRDSDSGNLPAPFPLGRVMRGPLGMQWTLAVPKSKALGEIDASNFSPPMYENGPWALSYGPEVSDVRPWAEVVLEQLGHPIMVAGGLEKGRVMWSGMNLPYHVISNVNLSEALLLAEVIRWIAPQQAGGTPEVNVQRPSPESVIVAGSGFNGVLIKETGFGGWGARMGTESSTSGLKIYRAGPDFMYAAVPAENRSNQIAVSFDYNGQWQDWALLAISSLTVLLTVDYVFGGRVAVRRLVKLASPLAGPTRRLKDAVSKMFLGEEE